MASSNYLINITGIVQGVGFRPFIYKLASSAHLTGWVRNTSHGVDIELNSNRQIVDDFINQINANLPPLARIDAISVKEILETKYDDFQIIMSEPQPGEFLPVSPDVKICPDCTSELLNPADRRYRYPFINCTNCGPRFSIIKDIPYDRPKTTMASFNLCPDCLHEYENPLDRRFHAQPVACPECGPEIWLEENGLIKAKKEDALQQARQMLRSGKILAIKGLGGYHLACDALNHNAVKLLRERKKRSDKPFALMAFSMQQVKMYCHISEVEEQLLTSYQSPIVLLDVLRGEINTQHLAPGQNRLGIMLAYTPLHLLLTEPGDGFPDLLVMTSGNISDEPIAYQDDDAHNRLSPLADAFLLHNRPIHIRVDDSVMRVERDRQYPLRRARGYAPDPILLQREMPNILACGAELKNTYCLTNKNYAFISHHIGDLENLETLNSFETGISHYQNLFRVNPELLVHDLHPDYLSTQYAHRRATETNTPLIGVQHHHAHLAACLADNQYFKDEPVIGLCLDGTGYGEDGAIWGGEILLGGYQHYERKFHLQYMPLPGGEASIRKPARLALAYLHTLGIEWPPYLPSLKAVSEEEIAVLKSQIEHKFNTPQTSSMGRLFDAVSALIGVRQVINYEGQAAIELESCLDPAVTGVYEYNVTDGMIMLVDVFQQILEDMKQNCKISQIAAKFHNTIAAMMLDVSLRLKNETHIGTIALSGGVWQNHTLLNKTRVLLDKNNFRILVHERVPTNDGGISLGQAVIGAAKFRLES